MTLASRPMTFASKIRMGGAALLIAILAPIAASAQGAGTAPGIRGAPATPELGTCLPTKVRFNASPSTANKTTSSLSFVDVFEGGVTFVQGGSSPSCIIVQFSAMAFAGGAQTLSVRALLDGTTTAQPGEMILATSDSGTSQVRTANFVFPLIAPGSHLIRMQWRSSSGGAVSLGRHITIAHFVP